jgi:CMP-N-acetylneuraminic acid synthetase
MKVVAYVPIKLNNERLPGKNTMLMNGKPLCSYLLDTLRTVSCIDEVYVFCSDPAIQPFIGGTNFLQRSPSLDTQQTTSNELTRAFASQVYADVYVLTHVTSPFLKASSLTEGVMAVTSGSHDSAFSMVETHDFTWTSGVPNYNPHHIPRTQDLVPSYIETSGFFVFTRDLALKHSRRVGDNPCHVKVSKIEAVDIDEPIDFHIAASLASYGMELYGNP